MNREEFDQELRSAVLEHEESNAASYNRNKVWRKSTGNRQRRKLIAGISIAATVLIALNILWMGAEKELVKSDKKGVKSTSVISTRSSSSGNIAVQNPAVAGVIQKIFTVQEKANESIIEYSLVKSEVVERYPMTQQPVIDNSQISYNQNVSIPPASVQIIVSMPVKDDIKVTFKRGRNEDEQPQPDIKISFRKGLKMNLDLKAIPVSDSSYYVNAPNPFKLKFK